MENFSKNSKKKAVIYARKSTSKQVSLSQQVQDLERYCQRNGWIVTRIFKDDDHGDNSEREDYNNMLDFAFEGKCDVVLVWKLDRFGRTQKELVRQMHNFDDRNIDIVSLNDHIDTTTPMGKAIYGFVAAMAEIELGNIRQRVKRGMKHARENGTKSGKPIGRPTVAEKEDVDLRECVRLLVEMKSDDESLLAPKHIQKRSGVSRSSYYRVEKVVDLLEKDPEIDFETLLEETTAGKRLTKKVQVIYNNLLIEK